MSGNTAPIETILEVSAFNDEARIDPHPKLKALREQCPVFRDEGLKTWVISEYETVRSTVNDPTIPRAPEKAEEGSLMRHIVRNEDTEDGEIHSILFLDNPDHARIRQPLSQAFYKRIQLIKPEIESIIDELIDAAPASGEFDLVQELAVPIPIRAIARILGVDEDRLADFRTWSEDLILGLNPVRTPEESDRMMASSETLNDYFAELMVARRNTTKEDLVSDMVALQDAGAPLTDQEIRTNLIALLVGGNLTTSDLIASGVWLFLTHPKELAKLRDDFTLSSAAVEEVLRFEGPVGVTSRVIWDEREVAGCPMHKSQTVFSSLHAANRDPKVFEDPETFNITRPKKPHVAFGGGAHICIGAPLARMEAKRAFEKIFQRYPNLSLAGPDPVWRTLPFFRGIETLLVCSGT